MEMKSSGSALLYLQLEINSSQKKSLSVINLDTTVYQQEAAQGGGGHKGSLAARAAPLANRAIPLNFTPNFLQINSPPGFFLFFCNVYGNSLRHQFFFVTPMRSSGSRVDIALLGESRGYCTKTKQEWPDSGSTLENIFVIFTNLIPRRIFFVLQKFWC